MFSLLLLGQKTVEMNWNQWIRFSHLAGWRCFGWEDQCLESKVEGSRRVVNVAFMRFTMRTVLLHHWWKTFGWLVGDRQVLQCQEGLTLQNDGKAAVIFFFECNYCHDVLHSQKSTLKTGHSRCLLSRRKIDGGIRFAGQAMAEGPSEGVKVPAGVKSECLVNLSMGSVQRQAVESGFPLAIKQFVQV